MTFSGTGIGKARDSRSGECYGITSTQLLSIEYCSDDFESRRVGLSTRAGEKATEPDASRQEKLLPTASKKPKSELAGWKPVYSFTPQIKK